LKVRGSAYFGVRKYIQFQVSIMMQAGGCIPDLAMSLFLILSCLIQKYKNTHKRTGFPPGLKRWEGGIFYTPKCEKNASFSLKCKNLRKTLFQNIKLLNKLNGGYDY
jgi:hypothetical protein